MLCPSRSPPLPSPAAYGSLLAASVSLCLNVSKALRLPSRGHETEGCNIQAANAHSLRPLLLGASFSWLKPPGVLRWPSALSLSETTQYPRDWDPAALLGGRGAPRLAQVQAFSPHAWHCWAASSSPLEGGYKQRSFQAGRPLFHIPLGGEVSWALERSRGSGRDTGWRHIDSRPQSEPVLLHAHTHDPPARPRQAPGHPSHPPGDPQSHSSPAGNSLAEAASHTSGLPHSSHPLTAEPSCNIQTF